MTAAPCGPALYLVVTLSESHMTNPNHFNFKHGKVGSRVYGAWKSMMDRCYRETHPYYNKYGGRGIKVCGHWHEFSAFYADMGDPPDGLSLDRVDNNGSYEPSNCRWATKKEQSVNRSVTRWIEFSGERLHLSGWAERLGVSKEVLHYRIKKFGVETAMTMRFGRWAGDVK